MDKRFGEYSGTQPHIAAPVGTGSIMRDVTVALLPASIFAVYNFGPYALALLVVACAYAMAAEYFWERLTGRAITLRDGSALVTGLLVGLNMPPAAPLWLAALGSVAAVLLFKQFFGGIGRNLINPAIGARCLLLVLFTAQMSAYSIDAYTAATPLMALRRGEGADIARMIVGLTPGSLGETSALALLAGGVYLLGRRVIHWQIPLALIGAFAVFMAVFGDGGGAWVLAQICAGGLLLGAIFMATDYVSSPLTAWGRAIYGAIIGVLTAVMRLWTPYPEGMSFAILAGNLIAPALTRITLPAAFGCSKRSALRGGR